MSVVSAPVSGAGPKYQLDMTENRKARTGWLHANVREPVEYISMSSPPLVISSTELEGA
jgi:hypothetical protein